MIRPAAAALALVISGCGEKTREAPAKPPAARQTTAATSNSGNGANVVANNDTAALPPSNAALRFVGTWAKDKASCALKPWRFTRDELSATDGPHCSIYDLKTVPGGYDIAVQCPAKKPDPTDLIKLRFAQSAGAMLIESNAIEPMGLIYCGK